MMTSIHELTFNEKTRELLLSWGFSKKITGYVLDFSDLVIALLISIIAYIFIRYFINRFLKRLILRSKSRWDDYLYDNKVFTRLALIVPALVIRVLLKPMIADYPEAISFLESAISLYMAVILIIVANSFLNALYHIYGDFEVASSKPIKGYVQIGKIIVFTVGGIIIMSMLIGQSPLNLLAGLGAMSAVLLLIFKDSILGFVAGVQISSNHMLMIGDWITVPKYNVDGVVIDISLVIVKVRNFDNSISTIPTYSLISESFQNWRGMFSDGGRRIRRSLFIDMNSVRNITGEMQTELSSLNIPGEIFKGATNLGVFRWYLLDYLRNHPAVNLQQTLMVRTLAPTETGLPLEIYGFSTIEDLVDFEQFQSGLMEFIISAIPQFGLRINQRNQPETSNKA